MKAENNDEDDDDDEDEEEEDDDDVAPVSKPKIQEMDRNGRFW